MEYCYTSVTQMLQCCYKKRRNNSVMRLKRFCNIMIVPLQTENSLVYGKRKSRKNYLDCRLDTIYHPSIAPYINLRRAWKGIGPMEYWTHFKRSALPLATIGTQEREEHRRSQFCGMLLHSSPLELRSNSIAIRQCLRKLDITLAALSFYFFTFLVILFPLSRRRLCQDDLHYGCTFNATLDSIVESIHVVG